MTSRPKLLVATAIAMAVVGVSAASADRFRLTPVSEEVASSEQAVDFVPDVESGRPTDPAELAELERSIKAEEALRAASSPAAGFERRAEAVLPPFLGRALDGIDAKAMGAVDGLSLIVWETDPLGGGLETETVAFSSDGSGIFELAFLEWPSGVDPSVFVRPEAKIDRAEGYELAIFEAQNVAEVILYDGDLVVRAVAHFEETVTVAGLQELVVAVYGQLVSDPALLLSAP